MSALMEIHLVDELKATLLAEQTRLKKLLANTQRHLHRRDPVSADFAEQATETENDEVVAALDQGAQIELSQINKALQRIESGDYGSCVVCGGSINTERLKAIPHTPFCIQCASAK
ncbi:TraR/DksA family transcriptional regulator [Marinicella meishanensis]|uniref:TraR/DksA family transcriptional regulator n=1 Tax=Marinicella meishanensis TaxID=2873263 RepID=UPI001CBED968|nr:TraR/DksA family transcriptional regulator [Marinicella sp. NBU2979]